VCGIIACTQILKNSNRRVLRTIGAHYPFLASWCTCGIGVAVIGGLGRSKGASHDGYPIGPELIGSPAAYVVYLSIEMWVLNVSSIFIAVGASHFVREGQ
jgi:hypothetical protein